MTESDFLPKKPIKVSTAKTEFACPSNIALVKYWGKFGTQMPSNPSISFTLSECRSITEMEYIQGQEFSVQLYLDNEIQESFGKKIEKYFFKISEYLPWILEGSFSIKTHNTFPHSSGIASSASGFGAIAGCLMNLEAEQNGNKFDVKKASFLARIGSGSACRSLYPGIVSWGKTEAVENSSPLFATPLSNEEIHPNFRHFNDWIVLIHEGEKSVSSSLGHSLMENHPYAQQRFKEAKKNCLELKNILTSGNLLRFNKLVEHEALSLHALMMMSAPAFILMQPNTLTAIQKLWKFREKTNIPICFTLDAGANIHILFPENDDSLACKNFIMQEILPLSQNGGIIKDFIQF